MAEAKVKLGKDGIWYVRPYLGVNGVTGKPHRPYKRFPDARSESEAQRMADEWVKTQSPIVGTVVSRKVGDLMSVYVEDGAAEWSANTLKTYRSALANYVMPHLGKVDIDEVGVSEVRSWQAALVRAGLSKATIRKTHFMLSRAWDAFAHDGIAQGNPFSQTGAPHPDVIEAVPLDEGEATRCESRLLSIIDGKDADSFMKVAAMASFIALHTGCRAGEACGLQVIDWSARKMSLTFAHNASEVKGRGAVLGPTKGKRKRTVSVDDGIFPDVMERFIDERSAYLKSRKAGHGRTSPLLTVDGSVVRPSDVSEGFKEIARSLGLPDYVHFHTLRHTHATILLNNGASIRDIQERFGHADIRTTMAIYGHLTPESDRDAARVFGSVISEKGGRNA